MLAQESLNVALKLMRRALSVIYMSVGFFLAMIWALGSYTTLIIVAYLAVASVIYPHVFRPIIRFRKVAVALGISPKREKFYTTLGFTVSGMGLGAVLLTLAGTYGLIQLNVAPLLGMLATLLSLAGIMIGLVGAPGVFGVSEGGGLAVLLIAIVMYLIRPDLVLPVTAVLFMTLGVFSYWWCYLRG